MTTLYLVRHGEAECNVKAVFNGHSDSPLSENGLAQTERLKAFFRSIQPDVIYCSDLTRTRQTARAISDDGRIPIFEDSDLRELYGGAWENMPFSEIERRFPEDYKGFNENFVYSDAAGAEPIEAFRARLVAAVKRIEAANRGKTVAIVSHGCAVRVLCGYLKHLPLTEIYKIPWADNASTAKFVCDDDGEEHLIYMGKNDYLGDLSTFAKQTWWKGIGEEKE